MPGNATLTLGTARERLPCWSRQKPWRRIRGAPRHADIVEDVALEAGGRLVRQKRVGVVLAEQGDNPIGLVLGASFVPLIDFEDLRREGLATVSTTRRDPARRQTGVAKRFGAVSRIRTHRFSLVMTLLGQYFSCRPAEVQLSQWVLP